MDDIKRSMYMQVYNIIKEQECTFICIALSQVLSEYQNIFISFTDDEIKETFPEFFKLKNNSSRKDDEWWPSGDKEPRLRILEYILNYDSTF